MTVQNVNTLGYNLPRNSFGIQVEPRDYCPRVPEHATVDSWNQFGTNIGANANQIGSVCAPLVKDLLCVTSPHPPDAHIRHQPP